MKTYAEIRLINVNDQVEKKGKFNYLSWAWAVDRLLQEDPSATWEYKDPVMFGDTMMVFCSVTAFNKTMTAQLPVMDNYNKPISNPNAFAVNTAMQRCLAKGIALHGLGLYIFAGEDTPDEDPVDVSPWLKSIKEAVDMDALKSVYIAAVKACGEQPELATAKDARKYELAAGK